MNTRKQLSWEELLARQGELAQMVVRYMPAGCGALLYISRLHKIERGDHGGYALVDDNPPTFRPIQIVPEHAEVFLNERRGVFSIELPRGMAVGIITIAAK